MATTAKSSLLIPLFMSAELHAGLFAEIDRQVLPIHIVAKPTDLGQQSHGVLILDDSLARAASKVEQWRQQFPGRLFVLADCDRPGSDATIPPQTSTAIWQTLLQFAFNQLHLEEGNHRLRRELAREHDKLHQLSKIGLALSAERNLQHLLTMILAEGRNWGCCDAASLFLIESNNQGQNELVFKLTQNDSVSFPFTETRFPLDKASIAGFVAVTGDALNIPDVYQIDPNTPFNFNSSFDESIQYRTRSLLAIPMKNHMNDVVGVLQFINRKTDPNIKLTSTEVTERHTLPFTEDITILLKALASQAAVAIGNNRLLSQIQQLFQGFVTASVHAIEQRDPTTSGHSFRVADLTTQLAICLPRSGKKGLAHIQFDQHELTEIRYASLLHDFGKVGVKEGVLTKAKKLPDGRLDVIWHRFQMVKERLKNQALQHKLDMVKQALPDLQQRIQLLDKQLIDEIARLDRMFADIASANEPSILPAGTFAHLRDARDWPSSRFDQRDITLLEEQEFLALSVRRGSLTEAERREIESHVVHTYNFLRRIPWTEELKRIPEIAVAHHEKLDGSGYPFGMIATEIPIASRMMTIADIYDALTAADRPYKRAMRAEEALDILHVEAQKGLLDANLVDVFVEAKVYACITPAREKNGSDTGNGYRRHVCDFEPDDQSAASQPDHSEPASG